MVDEVEQAVRPRTSTDDTASAERSMRMAVFLSVLGGPPSRDVDEVVLARRRSLRGSWNH